MTMFSPLTVVRSPRGAVFDEQGVLVFESALAGDQVDPVAHQLVAHHVGLLADDVLGP